MPVALNARQDLRLANLAMQTASFLEASQRGLSGHPTRGQRRAALLMASVLNNVPGLEDPVVDGLRAFVGVASLAPDTARELVRLAAAAAVERQNEARGAP